MAAVPEMERRGSLGSPNASKTSLPYPTYSKNHSKENIYSKEEAPDRKRSPFTPEATDVGDAAQHKERVGPRSGSMPEPARAPPSPPLTATTGADLRKTASANSMRRKHADVVHEETKAGRRSVDSGTRLTPEPRFAASRSSVRDEDKLDAEGTEITSTTTSQPSTVRQKSSNPTLSVPKVRSGSPSKLRPPGKEGTGTKPTSRVPSEFTRSTVSTATSVPGAWPQHDHSPTNSESSPASVVDSSPRTPTQASVLPSVLSVQKERPPTVEVFTDGDSRAQSVDPDYSNNPLTPPPPPPPPALLDPPRVDYLLQNGGLSRPVPRSILAAIDGTPAAAYNTYMSPRVNGPQAHDVQSLFAPLQRILDEYGIVMDRNGSLAVATGYRSIARRLLDRIEAVFARSIEHEICDCFMCFGKPVQQVWHERPYMEVRLEEQGVNWGEILELVSGRRELPSWPPINRITGEGLGITESSLEPPCQNIDVDVPEQYRDHYARQSQKTKVVVQSWLSNQQDSAPDEADDDTLNFAMLTRLDPAQRTLYHALLNGQKKYSTGRITQPPPESGTPPTIAKAALAIQRLYRLYAPPRNQLVVMYMIANPDIHTHLATLAAVSKHEWEILTSGRFDGFLWSGAENPPNVIGTTFAPSTTFTPGASTATSTGFPIPRTPHNTWVSSSSRPGSTRPGSVRPGGPQPVQLDEDTEIAVIAEIEREIYLGMEALEDQFELMHQRAEAIRARLRERGAALSMFAQARRGGALGGGVEVRMDTPASGVGVAFGRDLDEALQELQSEIGPDDSASNVSHNRRRRGHRAKERRTPAPVEEEDESETAGLVERLRRRL
ncbi:hypothetical protein BDV96DRAFT_525024 [Lophiotrema nucula]|uniref:Uncharacterized protein n=1 Tax=Lophiotrema nucula TaxID=690887 RepID=A0A6A5YYN2_9PLEO|nr:hypothetical protein BDV96DRAFT_525024 [Lophiotrema nucula]